MLQNVPDTSRLSCFPHRNSRRPLHGFTLIELLVVIAIISLLVSILLPSLQKAKLLAKDVVCQSSLRNLGSGTALYMSDHDGTIPAHSDNWSDEFAKYGSTPKVIENATIWGRLAPYVGREPENWQCAAADTELLPPPPDNWTEPHLGYYADYACNVFHVTGSTGVASSKRFPPFKKIEAVRRPAEVLFLIDTCSLPESPSRWNTRAYCVECIHTDVITYVTNGIGFRHSNGQVQMVAIGGNIMPPADFDTVVDNNGDIWGHSEKP